MSKKQEDVLILGAKDLVLEDLAAVMGDTPPRLELSPMCRERCAASRAVVERVLAEGKTVYGVNTGFGKLADRRIDDDNLQLLQRNLILSHATGVGPALPKSISRMMLVLRLQALSRGISGVRQVLMDRLLDLYNLDLLPVIPEQGSVGASGDLAPLAHMAIVLLGDGEVWRGEERIPAAQALTEKGIEPFELSAKEGLALINGTQCMTALGVTTLLHAERIVKTADVACALSLEALQGSTAPFQPGVHEARGQEGQIRTAQNLLALLAGSQVVESHVDCDRVQDPYSLRCVPQVHGAVRDAIAYVRRILSFEINAATDNPLIFANGDVISAGNFHGQPISQAMDFLGIALSTLANISERRIENMVNPALSRMPAFLAPNPGLESGFMIPQVVAASLASENKVLSHPSSVDTIPTSANQEDHVSMGVTAARHARDIAYNTAKVLGIELLCGAQGLSFHREVKAGKGVELAYACIREDIPPLTQDRFLAPDLRQAEKLVTSGAILAAIEPTIPLQA